VEVVVLIQKKWVLLSLLFIVSMLCIGFSAAQGNGAAKYGVIDAVSDLGLGTFAEALNSTKLADTLDNQGVILFGAGTFEVFAPSDEAFANFKNIDTNSVMENQTELKNILKYSIVWNEDTSANITDLSSAKTLQGENLSLNNENGLKINGANVTKIKKYDNGTIYVIDQVLLPKKFSSIEVADAANDLGSRKFAAAIKSAGFEERLNGQGPTGIESLTEGPFTIFAPSDAAFDMAKSAIDSINKKEKGMMTLLSYHMIDAKALVNMTNSDSVKTLQGDSLAVDAGTNMVSGANILRSERYDNGIVYVIDQVLVPVRLSM
jgi:uncharacterized surface protein with fasciclin (FAS1) repeats